MATPTPEDLFRTGGGAAALVQIDESYWNRLIGLEVGAYKLTELIGSGGMSVVYRARRIDGTIDRDVAIKFLRLIQSGEHLMQEARAVAALRHPNIVSLLDLGRWSDGTPYLVLELIEGETLDRYLDRTKPSLQSRLDLWLKLCDAVSTAHARFVAHRDIKPANILVSADGEPHLVDFGIASELRGSSPDLAPGVGTPYYAAPEVARGDADPGESAGMDQFALGMLLAELLLGQRTPRIEGSSLTGSCLPRLHEQLPQGRELAALAARMQVSVRKLQGSYRCALGDIVERATQDRPQARYPSVAVMADDVRAWREFRPLTARQRGRGYRLGKWLMRYRWPLLSALLPLSLGIAFTISTVLQSRRTEAALAQAQAERDRAEAINGLLRELLTASDPAAGGQRDISLLQAIERVEPRIDEALQQAPDVEGEVRYLLGATYRTLDAPDHAASLLTRALALLGDANEQRVELVEMARYELGMLQLEAGDLSAAARHFAAADYPAAETVAARWPSILLADGRVSLLQQEGRYDEALALSERIERVASAMPGTDLNGEQRRQRGLHLVRWLSNAAELEKSDALLATSRRIIDQVAQRYGAESLLAAAVYHAYAALTFRYGDLEAARDYQQRVIAIRTRLLGPDALATVDARTSLAVTLARLGEHEQAESIYAASLRRMEEILGSEHVRVAHLLQLIGAQDQARLREARAAESLGRALRIYDTAYGALHPMSLRARRKMADLVARQGDLPSALAQMQEYLQQSRDYFGESHFRTAQAHGDMAFHIIRFHALAAEEGSETAIALWRDAAAHYRESIRLLEPQRRGDDFVLNEMRRGLGQSLYYLGDYQGVIEVAGTIIEQADSLIRINPRICHGATSELQGAYQALGDTAQEALWAERREQCPSLAPFE